MWAAVFSSDHSVLQLPAAPTALARLCLSGSPRLARPSPGDLAAARGCPGAPGSHSQESGSGCQALGRESLSWGGLSGHCPEPQPSFQSCFPELCWAPGDPGDSGQRGVCRDRGMSLLRRKQNPAVLVPGEMPCMSGVSWSGQAQGDGSSSPQHLLAPPAKLGSAGSAVSKSFSRRKMMPCIN